MKKLIFTLTALLFVGCAKQRTGQRFAPPPVPPPPYQKPDLENCKNDFNLTVKFDKSNLNIGNLLSYQFKIGPESGNYADDIPIAPTDSYSVPSKRGQKFFVSAEVTGVGGSGSASEASVEVLTCEQLKKKLDDGEQPVDVTEVTLKFY